MNGYIYSVIFLFFILLHSSRILSQEIPFGRLSTEGRLSNNTVNCLIQDHLGFIWFGTEDGLNRYDGSDLKIYRNDESDSGSISSNGIWSLYEDRSGFLWIGTNSGELNRYDHKTDKFVKWRLNPGEKESRITAIYRDKNGSVWVGTYKDGLYKFTGSKKSQHWLHQSGVINSLSHNYVTSIVEDQAGILWISTYYGLNKFNPELPQKGFTVFYKDPFDPASLSGNLIWNLTCSKNEEGIIWIGTVSGLTKMDPKTHQFRRIRIPDEGKIQFGNSVGAVVEEYRDSEKVIWCATYAGLLRINLTNGKWNRYVNDPYNNASLSSNNINFILRDKSGVIWVATADQGLSFISTKSLKFNNLSLFSFQDHKDFRQLLRKSIDAVAQTPDGTIWLGTDKGLYSLGHSKNTFTVSLHSALKDLNVWSLEAGNSGDIWIGTYGQGLKQYNSGTHKLKAWNIENPAYSYKNPSFGFIKSILKDHKGRIWIGCWGPGLVRLDPETGRVDYWDAFEGVSGSLSYGDVWVLHEDSHHRIWIGTNGGGLNLFDEAGGKFHCWKKESKSKNKQTSLLNNNVLSICESRRSHENETIMWVGTGNGLNKLFITDALVPQIKFIGYTAKEGLPDNSIKSILEDEEGNIWIGTNSGISLLKYGSKKFLNFTAADGLRGNTFNSGSALKAEEGFMIFGSSSGLNIFKPEQIFQSEYSPPVLITRFQIFNKDVAAGNESPLRENPALAREINLSHDQNVFSFQFSSLDFNSPDLNRYAYMMVGFDRGWIYSGERRFITYTNLNPGKYLFRVKGTNSDGIWSSNEVSLPVIINPPWWKTSWAYSVYIIMIIGGILAVRKFQANRSELRNELKIREFEAKKLQELENLKSRFFANLSHEFRTPLMLIRGPIEQLLNKVRSKGEKAEELEMIQRNSRTLQDLIDQLLELSQLEAASIPLKAKKENLIPLLKSMVSFFDPLASQKSIIIRFTCSEETITAWVDRDKFGKIINNLLSNAIKFTPDGGKVSLTARSDMLSGKVEIKILDTGIGIPKDQQEKIFDRFYQIDSSSRRAFGGSGIGLSLVKELADLHKWKISVRSEPDKGTEFTLLIPLKESYLSDKEKVLEINSGIENPVDEKDLMKMQVPGKKYLKVFSEIENNIPEKPSILIVEDSSDVRKYLSELLSDCYKITEAEEGNSGLKIAAEMMPDLIISDIMMPIMDGLEFCRKIKTGWETSHIPVILLTAKASGESKIEGLETGADDYLTKPFEQKELFVRIKNLLELRKILKEKFSREIKISADSISTNSTDNEFLNKAINLIEKNLANSDFSSETFADEMFVSRSQLHRKLSALAGQSPGEFVRIFRLKHAARMLLEKHLSVTQIAFEVGFSSASHFTQAFQQYFACLPSEFRSHFNKDSGDR